jgi:hypothetical protein
MGEFLYRLSELLFILTGQLAAVFFSLPAPVQILTLVGAGYLWTWRTAWNAAVNADYEMDVQRADDRRRARLK